jgi:TonB family protein
MRSVRYIIFFCLLAIATAGAQDGKERKLIIRQEPEYPAIARQMNLHGTVKVKVWITPQGTVRRSEYVGGHPLLAQATIDTLKDWKYEPAPHETTTVIEVRF